MYRKHPASLKSLYKDVISMAKKFEYKFIYMPSHPKASSNGCVYEHILIAEQKLGRYLKDNEVVHHIDRNKKNNNPDNLMVFATASDHSAYHAGHPIYEKNGVWYAAPVYTTCDYCGKKFEKTFTRKGKHVYCSVECANHARRTKQKDNETESRFGKEELLALLIAFDGNFTQAAKSEGVTDNAIRKRCKTAGLSIHSNDYKLCF